MKQLTKYFGAVAAVVLIVLSSSAGPASAATSSGLSITPRKNYTIKPGSSITDKLTIGNLDRSADLNVSLKMIDFTFTDKSGTPKLFLADNAPQTTWSLKPFTTLPKSVIIPAGQTRTVSYSIKIPANQGAGSYYSAIQYAATGANGGNVSLSASGVTLVFVSVPGIVHEDMTLEKFGAYQTDATGSDGKYIFIATSRPPKQIGFTLKNNGNVVEAPAGSMTIQYMFGKKKNIDEINPTSALALIDQSRLFLTCIETQSKLVILNGTPTPSKSCKPQSMLPGRYALTLDAFYGQNGNKNQEITGKASFWYLPIWFIIAVIAIILVVGFLIWRLVRKIREAVNGRSYRNKRRR